MNFKKHVLLSMFFIFVMSASMIVFELYKEIVWLYSKEMGHIHFISEDKTNYIDLTFEMVNSVAVFNISSLVTLLCLAIIGVALTCHEFLTMEEIDKSPTTKIVPEESTPYKKLMETI